MVDNVKGYLLINQVVLEALNVSMGLPDKELVLDYFLGSVGSLDNNLKRKRTVYIYFVMKVYYMVVLID